MTHQQVPHRHHRHHIISSSLLLLLLLSYLTLSHHINHIHAIKTEANSPPILASESMGSGTEMASGVVPPSPPQLYFLQHRLLNYVASSSSPPLEEKQRQHRDMSYYYEPIFDFKAKGNVIFHTSAKKRSKRSRHQGAGASVKLLFNGLQQQQNRRDDTHGGIYDAKNYVESTHWDAEFFTNDKIHSDTLYQVRLCEVAGDSRLNCNILTTLPYCDVVLKLWKENWVVHFTSDAGNRAVSSHVEPEQNARIVSLEWSPAGKKSVSAHNPFKLGKENRERCESLIANRKQKGVFPKYQVKLQSVLPVPPVNIPYVAYQRKMQEEKKQAAKQASSEKHVPFYRKYWYIILGVVVLVVSSAVTAPEEEEKSS